MPKNRLKAISLVFLLGLCTGLGTGEAGQVTIVAGGNGQGSGTNQLNTPWCIAVAGGTLYIADRSNGRVQKVSSDGSVMTVSGGNGPGSAANQLHVPTDVTVDGGTLYVADYLNSRIQKVALDGTVTTVAGGNGNGSAANQLEWPIGVAVDGGTLYISDTQNQRVQKVSPNGTVTTVAGGNGTGSAANQLHAPGGVALDGHTLYVADTNNHRVQKISPDGNVTTVAGGNGRGSAMNQLDWPMGVAVHEGTLYIADSQNHRVQKVSPNGSVMTVAGGNGSGSAANQLNYPNGVALDGDTLYIADTLNHRVLKQSLDPTLPGPILFGSNRDSQNGLYTMQADGSDQRLLAPISAGFPSWSPDRSRIVFKGSGAQSGEIFAINADGTGLTQLTDNTADENSPRWSPDGQRIVFNSDRVDGTGSGDIWIMNADGTNPIRLTTDAGDNGFPNWSPDGAYIVFESTRGGDYQLYRMNPDGSDVTQLTSTSGPNQQPAWSPDGRWITFVSGRHGNHEIFILDLVGGTQFRVTNNTTPDFTPAWSPDGSRLVFQSVRDGNEDLYRIDTDGTNEIRLTVNSGSDVHPFWAPPGSIVPPGGIPTSLSLSTRCGPPGGTLDLPVTLKNPDATFVGGLQWQVIRGSASIAFDSLITFLPDFTTNTNTIGDTTFILFYSPTSAVIPPGTVTLGSLVYRISADAPLCTPIPLTIQALEISDSLGVALPDSAIDGEIQAGIPGDLNLDRRISVLDVIKLVRVIVARDPVPDSTTCQFFIADFNADDVLDVLDIIGQVNVILHVTKQIAAPTPTTALIRFGDAQASSSGGLVVPVELQSDGLVAGLQATVRFDPSAVSVGMPVLAGVSSGLSLDATVHEGTLRFVVFGTQPGQGIAEGAGAVLLIPITLRGGSTETPSLELSGVIVASAQAQRVPVTIGAPVKAAALPTTFSLSANRPNPFNPSTQIAYEVPQQAHLTLTVYNLLGQEVVRLVNTVQHAGRYTVTWDGRNAQGQAVSSGVYLYRLSSSTGFVQTRRMVLLK